MDSGLLHQPCSLSAGDMVPRKQNTCRAREHDNLEDEAIMDIRHGSSWSADKRNGGHHAQR